ncbi:MAG TPA: hypothetical protein VEC09_04565, partial [Actinomycetota bacterium]|nr:hypothetical protein [Actinomycetota bacterium]
MCFAAVEMKTRRGLDDSLDVVGVHLVGGITGALLTGVFASAAVNAAGVDGGLEQLGRQAAAVGITLVFSFLATLAIVAVVDRVIGLRVTEEDEEAGLDISQHAETAYAWTERTDAVRTVPFDPDAELARLRERLVVEATERTIAAIRGPDPLD